MSNIPTPQNPCMKTIPSMPYPGRLPTPTPANPTPTTPTAGAVIVNDVADAAKTSGLYNLNVLVLSFLPVKTQNANPDQAMIDDSFIHSGGTLTHARNLIEGKVADAVTALETASHGDVTYRIFGRVEIQEKYPLTNGTQYYPPGYNPPLVDYAAAFKRIKIADWVAKGVNQIWLFGPQNDGEHECIETLMSSQWGNISNSDGLTKLPAANKSYIMIFFNYDRDVAEFLESYCHQIEQMLAYVDGLATPNLLVNERLFWGKFCGAKRAFSTLNANNGIFRCGWSHCQPNSMAQYDWWENSSHSATTDFFDWKPDGGGATQSVNRETFNPTGQDDGGLGWKIAWMRALPRANNGLTHNGKPLTNWWRFIGDWDGAMRENMKLTL
jgi:hypothetical protein